MKTQYTAKWLTGYCKMLQIISDILYTAYYNFHFREGRITGKGSSGGARKRVGESQKLAPKDS